mgnify:CR=1 FL=1
MFKKSSKVTKDFTSKNRGQITESGPDDNPFYEAQYSNAHLAKTPLLTEGANFDQYVQDLKNDLNMILNIPIHYGV